MTYGDGGTSFDILTSLDVIAHEISHGVCDYTANLVYQGEAGAINESLSDIWAACVENYANANKQIWLVGEDIELRSGHVALRSMSNPNSEGQPDTYGGTYWLNPSSTSDNGGVHTNSGVMNYWFYLLSVGGSGTNDIGNAYNVTGIGIDKAEKIVYRAENVYMTANTNFNNARTYTIAAATDLYGATSNEVISVTNAWYAVGVGNHSYYITGPTLICNSSGTYTIANKPASATVTWSSSSNLSLSTPNGATSNGATFNAIGKGSAWVQAVVNINGTNYTLPQFATSKYDFSGTYSTNNATSQTLPTYGGAPLLVSTGWTDIWLNSLPNTTFTWSLASGSPYTNWSSSAGNLYFYISSTTEVYRFIATLNNSVCGTKTANYYFTANPNYGTSDGRPLSSYSYSQLTSFLTVDFGDQQQVATSRMTQIAQIAQTVYIVKIYDFNSSFIMQGSSAGESISFNLSGKPNGIYIVNICDANSNILQSMKFLKEN